MSPSPVVLWRAIIVGSTCLVFLLSGAAGENSDLIDTILKRITENYARLRTVQVTIERTLLDATVDKPEQVVEELAGGGMATFRCSPRSTSIRTTVLCGDDLRSDLYGDSPDEFDFCPF